MASRMITRLPRRLHPMASVLTYGPGGVACPRRTPRPTHIQPIHTSQTTRLKQIVVEEEDDGNTVTVEGRYLPSPDTDRLVKCGSGEESAHACPLCSLNLDVKHTDVLILSQFMTSEGGVLPRRTTGLCGKQQQRITWLVIMAQKAGLMPNLTPATSKKDPRRRQGSKKFNRYFDENTLPK